MNGSPWNELTLITTCKGRLHHLRESLPLFLGQTVGSEVEYRVVVVDYGCPDGAFDWCVANVDDPRLTVVGVDDDVELFNLSRARNIGGRLGGEGVLAFFDVDILLPPDALSKGLAEMRLRRFDRLNHSRNRHDDGRPCLNGQMLITSPAFHALRGYDEAMCCWGGDDIDLYERSRALGQRHGVWDSELRTIHHEDDERLRFVDATTKENSLRHNEAVRDARGPGVVNPHGYGASADHELWPEDVDDPLGSSNRFEETLVDCCVCSAPGWCDRHQCAKTVHWRHLCRTRPDYFALWESGRGPGQRGSTARPSVASAVCSPEPLADGQRGSAPLPVRTFAAVFEPLRGRRWGYVRMPGNVGDALIRRATFRLLRRFDVEFVEAEASLPDDVDGWLVAGGGNMGSRYRRCQALRRRLLDTNRPVVVLPQSFTTVENLPYERVWVRERASLRFHPDARLAPDLALAFRHDVDEAPDLGEGLWLRTDGEALFADRSSDGDPAKRCRNPREYLELAARHEHVVTDRLHFAIASLLCGRRTTLLPNAYHKNRSMYDTWLADLGCRWRDEP